MSSEAYETGQSQQSRLKEISPERLELFGLLTEHNSPNTDGEPEEGFIISEKSKIIYEKFKINKEENQIPILERIQNAKPIDPAIMKESTKIMEEKMKEANLKARIQSAKSQEYAEKTLIPGIIL